MMRVASRPGRRIAFAVGDCLFLILISTIAAGIMQLLDEWDWPFVAMSLVGMAAAMLVQMLLAVAVSPLLGSIESMTPSMVIAMITPMTMDAMHLLGADMTWGESLAFGAAMGAGMFVFVEWYGRSCRRLLSRAAPT